MGRVLIVPSSEFRTANSSFRRLIRNACVTVFSYDFYSGCLQPKTEIGRVYSAEVCVVGINPKVVIDLRNQYQFSVDEVFKGSVKSNNAKIQAWLCRTIPEAPDPTYSEIVSEIVVDYPRLVMAENALGRADRVSASRDDSADKFPAFLRESVKALGEFSQRESSFEDRTLKDYFARNTPSAKFASSGSESFEYWYLFGSVRRKGTTRKHLKPKSEMGGWKDRSIKPRLYFDVRSRPRAADEKGADEIYVFFLYFGPHPPEGSIQTSGEIVIPTKKKS